MISLEDKVSALTQEEKHRPRQLVIEEYGEHLLDRMTVKLPPVDCKDADE